MQCTKCERMDWAHGLSAQGLSARTDRTDWAHMDWAHELSAHFLEWNYLENYNESEFTIKAKDAPFFMNFPNIIK